MGGSGGSWTGSPDARIGGADEDLVGGAASVAWHAAAGGLASAGADAVLFSGRRAPLRRSAVRQGQRGLLRLRKELGLFANAPAKVFARWSTPSLKPELVHDLDIMIRAS
jgi:isocitrate/isopropylmalate dehydrogenase